MSVRRNIVAAPAMLAVSVGTAAAQGAWPDFETCVAIDVWRFETALARSRERSEAPDLELLTRRGVDHCGTLGITRCDLSAEPLDCQAALAETQLGLRDAVLDGLPAPEALAAPEDQAQLYASVRALAGGSSAGPDCEGTDDIMAAWCAAHEANLSLGIAVLAWRVARMLDAVGPAEETGWIAPVPPMPQPRPEGENR